MADESEVNEIEEFIEKVGSESNSPSIGDAPEKCVAASPEEIGRTPNYADVSCWAVSGNDAFFPCETTAPKLPPGYYVVKDSPRGLYFHLNEIHTDTLLELPDSASMDILTNIRDFWKSEDKYRKLRFLWKRGILMWGPPGSGKTCTVQLLCKEIVKQGGVALHVTTPSLTAMGLSLARKIEPNRPIVAVLEDIDAIVRGCGEAELLALLDGKQQVDNIVFIATTNYPERLDGRIVNRPSRFDVVRKIPMPSSESRDFYLRHVHPEFIALDGEASEKLDCWVEDTDGLSIAHVKELIVATEVFGSDYEESLQRLKAMAEKKSHSKDFERPSIEGFGRSKSAR